MKKIKIGGMLRLLSMSLNSIETRWIGLQHAKEDECESSIVKIQSPNSH
jgi:hypothetical protein